ncbi:MAG: hypothetical protein IE926_01615 [Micrococcales bacterium]|nr:hypothetical protein [Micrococcales bacterium]
MTTLPTSGRAATGTSRGWAGTSLLVVLAVVALNAVYGGVGLMVNGLGMPPEWLENLPVDTWVLPGVALLVTVALPQAGAAALVWHRDPRAAVVGGVVGLALVLWIVVQLLLLRRYFVLQPVIAGLGLVEMALALVWHDRRTPAR